MCIFLRVQRFSITNRDFPHAYSGAVSNTYVAFAACFFTSISRRESLVSVCMCLRVPELNRVYVLVLVGRGEDRKRLRAGEGREGQKLKPHARMERTEKRGEGGERVKTEEPERRWVFRRASPRFSLLHPPAAELIFPSNPFDGSANILFSTFT